MAYLGKTPSQAVRSRYYYTATGGETSLSGADDNSNVLTFTDGNYVDVSLNGVALVAGTDYNTTTTNTIGGLTALVASDVVEVIVYDTFSVFSGNVTGDFTVGGTLTAANITNTGNLNFGDNDKAIFGAGSGDLEIYSDGTYSRIMETGGLFLVVDTNGSQISLTADNSKNMGNFIRDGAVQLYFSNAQKFSTTATGVYVTGAISSNKGSAGTLATFTDGVNSNFVVETSSLLTTIGNGGGSAALALKANNTEAMRIDSSGNVGIGGSETTVFNGTGGDMKFVVIGDDSTTTVANNSDAGIAIVNTSQTAGNLAGLHFARADTDNTPNYAGASIVAQFPDAQVTGQYPRGDLAFLTSTATNSAPSEKMRLTAGGSLGISKSAYGSISNDGFWFDAGSAKFLQVSSTGNSPLFLNRNGSDGGLINFYKSGTNVGSIGVDSGDNITFGATSGGGSGLFMFGAGGTSPFILPMKEGALSDNTVTLGDNARRFKDLYLSGGVYLGGTGSANHLHYYEEGAWTPALNGGLTPSIYQASFTVIGNRVFLTCNITVPTNSVNSAIIVSGLPYSTLHDGSGALSYTNLQTTNDFFILVQGSQIYFYKGIGNTNYLLSDFSGYLLRFTAQYNINN